MSLFALPLAPSDRKICTNYLTLIPSFAKKSKRKHEACSPSTGSILDSDGEERITNTASKNPLSLSPNEINQYMIAGLELNDKLPEIKGWPHRGFAEQSQLTTVKTINHNEPTEDSDSSHAEETDQEVNTKAWIEVPDGRKKRDHGLRFQHISVITTILHKCLQNRDFPRASRAWALLIRTHIARYSPNLKDSGYWGIGAELLIQCSHSHSNSTSNFNSRLNAGGTSLYDQNRSCKQNVATKWDLVEGLRRASDYYERLILEYPFYRRHSGYINASDWWPVMISSEIYRIQFEQKRALHNLEWRIMNDEEQINSYSEEIQREKSQEKMDEFNECQKYEMPHKEKNQWKLEKYWQANNQIRLLALGELDNIITKLKERMTIPPYSENHDLLRLRGMLALYVGDLCMPLEPEREDLSLREGDLFANERNAGEKIKTVQRKLFVKETKIEYEKSLARRNQELRTATEFFDKLRRENCSIGIPVQ